MLGLYLLFVLKYRNYIDLYKPCIQNSKKLSNLFKLLSSFILHLCTIYLLRLVSLFHDNTFFGVKNTVFEV